MLAVSLLTVLATAVSMVVAVPFSPESTDEVILFKRDSVLTPRDLELAELHNVNVTEMWKHSVIKRADGDDTTIWVHNSYVEEAEGVEKRQTKLWHTGLSGGRTDNCGHSSFVGDTGPGAPFTGGIQHMARWGASANGHFFVNGSNNRTWWLLVIAGSNSGANASFQARASIANVGWYIQVGARDVGDLSRDTNNRFARKYGNSWRARARGHMECQRSEPFPLPGMPGIFVEWRVDGTDERAE